MARGGPGIDRVAVARAKPSTESNDGNAEGHDTYGRAHRTVPLQIRPGRGHDYTRRPGPAAVLLELMMARAVKLAAGSLPLKACLGSLPRGTTMLPTQRSRASRAGVNGAISFFPLPFWLNYLPVLEYLSLLIFSTTLIIHLI